MRGKLLYKLIYLSAPPLLMLLVGCFKKKIVCAAQSFPKCKFYELTGYYCPACGNTRSVLCMLDFSIFKALKYNATPVVLSVILLMLYVQLGAKVFRGNINSIRVLPRKGTFWYTLIALMTAYYVFRNLIPGISPLSNG